MSESGPLGKRPSKSRAYYKRSLKKRKCSPRSLYAGPEVQGVLITTGDKVKFCVPEAYNLLNEYGDQLYGEEDFGSSEGSEGEGTDAGPSTERPPTAPDETCPTGTTKEKARRFASMDTGAKHVVFIRCSEEVDPTHLVHTMLMDIHTTKVMKSRFCQRILPVVRVCHASLDDIQKSALEVLEPHFHGSTTDSHTFAVNYKSRNNNTMKRDQVINLVAGLVTLEDQYPHRVNFDNPELTIIVEIIKNLCCLSVVRDFSTLRKYNIQSLTAPPPSPPPPKATQEGKQEGSAVDPMREGTDEEVALGDKKADGAGVETERLPPETPDEEDRIPAEKRPRTDEKCAKKENEDGRSLTETLDEERQRTDDCDRTKELHD